MTFLRAILAQSAPATQSSPGDFHPFTGSPLHFPWRQWIDIYDWTIAVRSASALVLLLLLGLLLSRIFRRLLVKYELLRAVRWGFVALAIYAALIATHPDRMTDSADILALVIHKAFVAIILVVVLRFLDRLLIIPILTRGGRVTLSRFVHQIVVAIVSLFFLAGYLHWAFDLDVSSVLAGSAVISIVLGLALQETLGNFFSGMVLQASVPFAAGDWISIGEGASAVEGRVVEMTWRAVTLLAPNNNNVLIPNSVVARTRITNFHTPTPNTATGFSINLPVDLPPHEARRILLLAAADTPGVVRDPAPSVSLDAYKPSSITYALGFWINQPDQHGGIEAKVRWNVWYRLRQAGIRIPSDNMNVEVAHPARDAAAAAAESRAARLLALQKSPLFAAVSPELQQQLAAETSDFQLAEGQVFYRQDEVGDSLFLILSGTVHAVMRFTDGREIDLGDTSIGGVFGEVSAFTGQPRTATVSAKTDVRAAEITRQHLQRLLAHDPLLAEHMSQIVAQSQTRREAAFQKLGAIHPTHGQNVQPQNVLTRMKAFLNLLHA
jgi:small-conductance mechanosensitive channel/CRP-like cAMP-binding protein